MKRLKYRCPFGGKRLPLIGSAVCVVLISPLIAVLEPKGIIKALILLSPAAVLAIGCIMHQSLSPSERSYTASLSYPLWEPVTPEIKAAVTAHIQITQYSMLIITAISAGIFFLTFVILLFPISTMYEMHSLAGDLKTAAVIACCVAVIGFFVLFLTKGISGDWLDIDDSAVYTKVPIDHMYDVEHYGKNGHCWYTSYLVFYQPDGRYTLRAPSGSGECNTVVVVKFRNRLTWYPVHEQHPEDFQL